MKRILISLLACSTVILFGCSSETPPPQKISQDMLTIPSGTVISAFATETLDTPVDSQALIKTADFKLKDNLYSADGSHVILRKGAILQGLYTNDGVNCTVAWKSVAYTQDNQDDKKVSTKIADLTQPSACDPTQKIKKDDRVTIRFN